MRTLLLCLGLAFSIMLASCTGSDAKDNPSADQVLSGAREAMRALQSYRYEIEVAQERANGKKMTTRTTVALSYPDRAHVRFGALGAADMDIQESIYVAGRTFLKGQGGTVWQEDRGASAFGMETLLKNDIVPQLDAVTIKGEETLDGEQVYRLEGSQEIKAPEGIVIPVNSYTLWVSIESLQLRQMSGRQEWTFPADTQIPPEEQLKQQIWNYRFLTFNEPVDIKLPENRIDLPPEGAPILIPTQTR